MPPFPRVLPALLACALLAFAPISHAQDSTADSSAPARRAAFVIPPDINQHRVVFPAPATASTRPLRIGLYEGKGSAESGIVNLSARLAQLPGATLVRLSPEDLPGADLSAFDVIAFTGGYSVNQAASLGPAGKDAIRRYVAEGGRYLGICAGAYLALVGEEWSLGLLNARLVPGNRWRGQTFLDVELTPEGRTTLAPVNDVFKIRYNNGPVIRPLGRPDMPPYTELATFRSEIVRPGGQPGLMVGTPAIVIAPYGRGRVLAISPHPENTPGLEHLVSRAVLALVAPDPAPASVAAAGKP